MSLQWVLVSRPFCFHPQYANTRRIPSDGSTPMWNSRKCFIKYLSGYCLQNKKYVGMYSTVKLCVFLIFFIYTVYIYTKILFESFLQPSLLALALLRLEAEEQHDQQHVENIAEALQSLQQQLNVSKQYHFTRGLRVVAQSCLLARGWASSLCWSPGPL